MTQRTKASRPHKGDAGKSKRSHKPPQGKTEVNPRSHQVRGGDVRLQKLLADAGVASRRRAEEMILAGRVKVDSLVVTEMGYKAAPGAKIMVDDVLIRTMSKQKIHIMLNKPRGVLSSASDDRGRSTVLDLLTPQNEYPRAATDLTDVRLFPVGRLDYNTSGLVLITNDGDFSQRISHPSGDVHKTYIVTLQGKITAEALRRLRQGVLIDDGLAVPIQVEVLPGRDTDIPQKTRLRVVLGEGRNRQVRKMCEVIGYKVLGLRRTKIGELGLGDLPNGNWRLLSEQEATRI